MHLRKIIYFIFIVTIVVLSKPAKAQFDYIGGGIALATGGEYKNEGYLYYNKSFGIDLRTSYNYSKKIKIVPDLKFYLPNKEVFVIGGSKTTLFVLNINAHYILNSKTRDNYRLYIIAGAHVGAWSIKDNRVAIRGPLDVNKFEITPGANAGAGMQFEINNRIQFFAEVKYVIAKANQLVFSPGLLYAF